MLFSGSKAHGGAAYDESNRRLHIYFISTTCTNILPVDDEDKHSQLIQKLSQETILETEKIRIQFDILQNLEVYDVDEDECDVFEENDATHE
jgi:hypothetical protein